jgi:hypothetical protein
LLAIVALVCYVKHKKSHSPSSDGGSSSSNSRGGGSMGSVRRAAAGRNNHSEQHVSFDMSHYVNADRSNSPTSRNQFETL